MTLPNTLEASVIDEIALEGLDGITLQALWLRLAHRFNNPLQCTQQFMNQIWSMCVNLQEFTFYKLKVPRNPLVIYDRYEFVDPDLGIILEPDNIPEDIYPFFPINDPITGVRGSCSTYKTRKVINVDIRKYTLEEATKEYDQRLVIVASQAAREFALMGDKASSILKLSTMHYCFLERVGRSRYHGEVTQGKISLSLLREDPRTLFYHRKFLLRHKLITKQTHHQKTGGHSCTGSLLHLPRFFVERKPKMMFLAEQVIEILKTKKNYIAEYEEVKKKLQIANSIQKLVKTSFFQKAVRTDLKVPYRTLYPNAEPKEWQRKNDPSKEKVIRVIQLITPDVDIAELLNKDEIHEDEEQLELDIRNHKYDYSYLKEANNMNEGSSINGVSQGSLSKDMGLTKLQCRTILRNLVKMDIVATYMNDAGRQRVTKYVSKKFEANSTMSMQFKKEMNRIKELTKHISNKKNEVIPKQEDLQEKESSEVSDFYTHLIKTIEKLNYHVIIDNKTKKHSDVGEQEPFINTDKLRSVFRIVSKIFWKYRITKSRTRYKCTFLNVSRKIVNLKLLTNERQKEKSIQNGRNIGNTSDSFEDSTVTSTISNNIKDVSMYKSIETNLVTQNPIRGGKPINEIFGLMEDVENSKKKSVSNITYRLLKRANMIIESVKEHQVIDDITKLMKMINDEEDKEGYDVKIDKKSLLRLLQKLAKDNLVKNIKLTLSANGREKHLTFVCDPNIDTDHTVIKSAVEQAKVKFCLLGSSKSKTNSKNNIDKTRTNADNTNKRPGRLSALPTTSKYDPKAARKLGYSPKFVRMQALHVLLYYLVYEHPGEDTLSKNEQIQLLRANDFSITDSLAQEMSKIYTTEVGWKMFLPSLPQHNGWPKGWTLMCDLLLRIPLSIFLKVHSVPFIISGLEYYTNHPIRKHYLIKDLPMNIQSTLLHGRKYIFDIHETVTRLCYIGLVQFGPQKLKEKDQVFLYVNRHSELMDTTSSAPGYHKIEEKTYPITKYNFNEMDIVEKYWYDMWNICVNTPLGGRLAVQGKDILLEDLSKKSDMIETIKARTAEEAIILDTGKVPGDRKGAAGIDSAFFAHLKRNWNWNNNFTMRNQLRKDLGNKTTACKRDAYLSTIKAAPVKYTEFSGLKKVSGPTIVNATDVKTKSQSNKVGEVTNKSIKHETYTKFHRVKQKSFIRRVLPKKAGKKSRVKYDEIDYRALQLMHKLRVDWKPHEDNILLICKVAMMYLCPNHRKQVVSFNMVRDVLRSYSLSSYNKTSRACQRRLLYMLRQPQTVNSVTLGVEEIKQNFFLNKRFGGITEKIKQECPNHGAYEKRIAEVFKDLVNYVAKKYYDISEMGSNEPIIVPKTVQEFNIFYKMIYPTKSFNSGFFKDIRCINDIHSATINSVIHSSMCSGKDKKSWAYQLFKVYQQYPEVLLKNAMAKIRADQLVTIKKNDMHLTKKYANYMPMSSAQYQFSTSYIYKFQNRWPYDLYMESYNAFFKLIQWYFTSRKSNPLTNNVSSDGMEIIPVTGGIVAMIHDFMPMDKLDFDIAIPDQVITLDQSLKEKNETYFRIAQRYKDILDGLDYFKDNSDKKTNLIENNKISIFKKETLVDHRTNNGSSILEEVRDNDVGDEPGFIKARKVDHNFRLQLIEENNLINSQDETKTVLNKTDDKKLNTNFETYVDNLKNSSSDVLMDKEQLQGNHLKRKCIDNCEIDSAESTSKKAKMDDDSKCSILNSSNDTARSNIPTDLNKCLIDFDEKMDNAETSLESRLLDDNSVGSWKSADDENIIQKIESQSNDEYKKTNDNAFTRISSIICSKSKNTSYANSYAKLDDTNDVQKRFTRLALLKIREELNEFSVSDSHHAHEYFVVNMFKIFYYLESSKLQHCDEDYEEFKSYAIPSGMLPLKLKTVSEIINDLNKFAIFPKNNTSYANFKKTMNGKVLYNWMKIDAIYKFVREKKEIGASSEELMEKFRKDFGRELYDIVSLLIENYLFLRSGVTTPRYIHHLYVNPWLIHSYKIFRLERESLLPIPKGSIYLTENQTNADINIDDIKKDNDIDHNKNSLESSICDMDITMIDNEEEIQKKDTLPLIGNGTEEQENATIISNSDESEKEPNVCATKRLQRKRISLLPQKDIFTSAKKLDLTTAEEIRVVMKPWIRIDGVLNRRVLDRMLGAVLTYCLTHPGVTLVKVQNRFSPVLQPFHTRELIEILIKLGCLEKKILIKQHVTLFSKPAPVKPKTDEEWVSEEEIFIEPLMGAIIKFSIFLSTKMYNSDYIP
ncbi:PREDICTED: general transcription factor 3C polypeptide 1 [Polistes canadensis]|uniref:general transcription factor 3C polypeptide 1 n=1 Tax=Polistes canadensis TaxID=91411 RepID=UPI000718DCB8|nr:PREDICTED: general transcription factor 3C polypeptide 1 [Polistes canadensis]